MRYLMLICTDESADAATSPAEAEAGMAEYGAFMEEMGKRDVLQGGERLRPTTDATTVRVQDGETAHLRRPVRRDERADRRLLRGRRQGPRRSHRDRGEDPRRPLRVDRGAADLGDVTPDVEEVVAAAFREEWGRVVATLIRVTGDWDVAEECAQDAFVLALQHWRREGVPRNPGAWLTTTARNRAVDRAAAGHHRRVETSGGHCALVGRRSVSPR